MNHRDTETQRIILLLTHRLTTQWSKTHGQRIDNDDYAGAIFSAQVVFDPDLLELPDQVLGLIEQHFEIGVLNAVFAAHLFDDQFAVAANNNIFGAEPFRFLKRGNQCSIFGDVVRRSADEFAERNQRCAILRGDEDPDPRRPGIAAASPVEVENKRLGHHV